MSLLNIYLHAVMSNIVSVQYGSILPAQMWRFSHLVLSVYDVCYLNSDPSVLVLFDQCLDCGSAGV